MMAQMDGMACGTLARRLGLSATTRGNWAAKFDLCQPPARARRLDVIEHCAVRALEARVPRADQVTVWRQIRPQLRQFPAVLDALVDSELRVTFAYGDHELASIVRQSNALVVIDLAAAIHAGRELWDSWAGGGGQSRASSRGKPRRPAASHSARRGGGSPTAP
jgi:hypothetical protein